MQITIVVLSITVAMAIRMGLLETLMSRHRVTVMRALVVCLMRQESLIANNVRRDLLWQPMPMNIGSIMAEVGVPGDVTIPDGAILNCQAEAEDACNAMSPATPDAVSQTYAECLGNTILTDVSVGIFYDDLVNALLGHLR